MKTYEKSATVVSADQIIAFVDRIVTSFKPRRIVLFGSYACGRPTEDSDVDLLITRQRWSMSPLTAAGKIRQEIEAKQPSRIDLRAKLLARKAQMELADASTGK